MRGDWCIVKIPPVAPKELIDKIVDCGYNQIHASNTLATKLGGVSGSSLVPYTLGIIDYIKSYHEHVEVIAGGGVTTKADAQRYFDAGADHVSIGTACFTPWKINKIIRPV